MKKMTDEYKKLTQRQHVYELPDSYVGSVAVEKTTMLVAPSCRSKPYQKEIDIVPALFKIYDEVLVNAIDQHTRRKTRSGKVTEIRITVTAREIKVENNGEGIPIKRMAKYDNIYIPELIFGHLLTSSNYAVKGKTTTKITGGKNGFGAKLANIFSSEFEVETTWKGKMYRQKFGDNMKMISEPVVKPVELTKADGTSIRFRPDLERFGLEEISNDVIDLFRRRAWDTAAWCCEDVDVWFNEERIQCANFREYCELISEDNPLVHLQVNKKWEIGASTNDNEIFEHMSLVNGINTSRGGTHVNAVASQICNHVATNLSKKHKTKIKPIYVKNQLRIFAKCVIINPSFSSQTKETLTTNPQKFGSKCIIPLDFIKRLLNETDLEDRVMKMVNYKEGKTLSRSDGKKTNKIKGVPKLCDANKAGGRLSHKCALILTEGDSAKTMAVAGLSVVGRDFYGVYPLRGKLMNVKDADASKISKNSEISDLKKILGLKEREQYGEKFLQRGKAWPLRYGKIIIMTDQDADGSHIKGLLMNLFHSGWKGLLERGDFVTALQTPIVKARPSKQAAKQAGDIEFYTLQDYERWAATEDNIENFNIKYYKGLGTSTPDEAKSYFKNMKLVSYSWDSEADDAMNLAFSKSKSDERKEWLQGYDKSNTIRWETKQGAKQGAAGTPAPVQVVRLADFVHKELIHYSHQNVMRSIPSLLDGLKPSQRKILHCVFKKKMTREIKVAQLAGYVSEHGCYHHGENSLQDAIVGLAQDFTGSNNVPLLLPRGTFGSRLHGGKDAASSRYIFTELNPIARRLFPPEDRCLAPKQFDEGREIEPRYFCPVIPMVLVNGALGIGTGFSTFIPMHNPHDLIQSIRKLLKGRLIDPLVPWYRNWKGSVWLEKGHFVMEGKYEVIDPETIKITELPPGTWTEKYKDYLEKLVDKKKLRNYVDHSTPDDVAITLQFVTPPEDIGSVLRLRTKKHFTNMYLLNANGAIKKYDDTRDILREFYTERLNLYERRRTRTKENIDQQIIELGEKMSFIKFVLNDELDLRSSKASIEEFLEKNMTLPPDKLVKLLNMNLTSLNEENVLDLQSRIADLQRRKRDCESTTAQQTWLDDLAELEKRL